VEEQEGPAVQVALAQLALLVEQGALEGRAVLSALAGREAESLSSTLRPRLI
jgi:hypothetical protein